MPSSRVEYDDPPGTHRHQCQECDTVWSHGNDCASGVATPRVVVVSHLCPKCGARNTEWYSGEEPPTFVNHHLDDPDTFSELEPTDQGNQDETENQ